MKREEYEERMRDSKYRELTVTNCDSGKDYVFISYRGNSWKRVLTDIVYRLQKEYKLRIYFDKEFASDTNIWIEQFIKNMDSKHCKACLCFFDKGYVTSYATLLELMHAMNPRSKLADSIFPISFPIDWKSLDSDDWDTGLGKEDPDNPGWKEEKIAFEREFKLIKKKYPDVDSYYYEGAELRECDCKDIMAILQPKNKRDYADEDSYFRQFIVDPLKKKFPEVFEEIVLLQHQVSIINYDKKDIFEVKDGDCIPKQDAGVREGFEFEGWFVSNTDEEWDFSNSVYEETEIYAKWDVVKSDFDKEYRYTILGEEYNAGSREQGKLMFDTFEALVERYPECVDLLTQRTSISRAEDVKGANTKEAIPTYFRGCKEFEVNGCKYLVGTSYGFKAKIAEIKGMFNICGADLSEFVLNGEPLNKGKSSGGKNPDNGDVFEYQLWGVTYDANKMVDMLNDVFDLIAEKHPQKVKDIAKSEKITSVALKTALEQKTANVSKIKQFDHYKGKEHTVDGEIYCVNAGYNRDGCIKQIEKMLIVCDGDSNGFKITKAPEKSSHVGNKSGKEGIGEILNQ